jgi:hypothetical protein
MKKKVDPLKEAEKARQDAARMKQMGEATASSGRKLSEDWRQAGERFVKKGPGT